jgi:hypothetical protein
MIVFPGESLTFILASYWQSDLELEYSGPGVQTPALDDTRLQELGSGRLKCSGRNTQG